MIGKRESQMEGSERVEIFNRQLCTTQPLIVHAQSSWNDLL